MAGTDVTRSARSSVEERTDAKIPSTRAAREALREAAEQYVSAHGLAGSISLADLREHAANVLRMAQASPTHIEFTAVLLSNAAWRAALAAVPMDRRLLLLPQCLRDATACRAEIGELGLGCRSCGACVIGEISSRAKELGYVVLVAEGSALVTSLVASGRIEAIVGVGCLGVLEQVFPYMWAASVPAAAIGLLRDGCRATAVDLEWVWDALELSSNESGRRMDLENLHREVSGYFSPESLRATMDLRAGHAGELALEWMARSGKRWRPFLSACVYRALQPDQGPLPEDFRKVAMAVECFHKASLIHDDIEDHDELRYGQRTLHEEHGVPIALNVGDLLVGQGYRMIASCQAPPAAKALMLAAASRGHCELCAGQGGELEWMSRPGPLSVEQVVEIFRRKTAPAFDVALNLGAIYAGADGELPAILSQYSRRWAWPTRYATTWRTSPTARATCRRCGRRSCWRSATSGRTRTPGRRFHRPGRAGQGPEARTCGSDWWNWAAPAKAQAMLEQYKNRAVESLGRLGSESLKALLCRIVGRIFLGTGGATMSCCDEHTPGHG